MEKQRMEKEVQWVLIHAELKKRIRERDKILNAQSTKRTEITNAILKRFQKKINLQAKEFRLNRSAKIIQKTWNEYVKTRYQHLGLVNLDDCDPITLAEIHLIPKTDLYIWYDCYRRPRGGNLFEFLKWISKFTYLEIPKHYTREKLQPSEINWLIDHGRKIVQLKKFSSNPYQNQQIKDQWLQCLDYIEEIHKDRLDPMRVYNRLLFEQERLVGQLISLHQPWSYLITFENLQRYLGTLKTYNVPEDLQPAIQMIPLKVLSGFQETWEHLGQIKIEIEKFKQIFLPRSL